MSSPIPPRPLQRSGVVLLVFLLLLLCGTRFSNHLYEAWRAQAPDSKRNPFLKRGWIEHVLGTPPARENELLVLLIGNSQGYALEIEDRDTTAQRLERLLSADRARPARVVNWSIFGGDGPEFVVLAAAARRLKPDIVLSLLAPSNFDRVYHRRDGAPTRLSRFPSDIRRLIAYPEVRSHLPASFKEHYIRAVDRLDGELAHFWRPWRYRDLPAHFLAQHKVFGKFHDDRRRWGHVMKRRPPKQWTRTQPFDTSWELVDWYGEVLAALPGRRIFGLAPEHSRGRAHYAGFGMSVQERLAGLPIEYADWSAAVPDEFFLSNSHLDEQGHRLLAGTLKNMLAP